MRSHSFRSSAATILIGFAVAIVFVGLARPSLAQTAPTVSFRVFDEAGVQLDYPAVLRRMSNGKGGNALSSGTAALRSSNRLRTVTLNRGYPLAGLFTVPLLQLSAYPRQGILVHWNTVATGYSLFLLDNDGEGFSQTETINFNRRLALDIRRQFEAALASKLGGLGTGDVAYRPSATFNTLKTSADACFGRLETATTESAMGKIGQYCANRVAQAMTRMMREYGVQRAAWLGDRARWGVTIEPTTLAADMAKIDDLVALFDPQHRWLRFAMVGGGGDNLELIRQLAEYAAARGVRTVGQLFDSYVQADVPLDVFKARVDEALAVLGPSITAWEVGNEANGSWLGDNVPAKIEYAAKKAKALGREVMLTFYWSAIEDELPASLFNWILDNVTPAVVQNVDSIALSIYVDDKPLNFSWDTVMTRLSDRFPGKPVLTGELGFEPAGFFHEGPKGAATEVAAKAYIQNRYASAFATRRSVGGGYWWTYGTEMAGRTLRWHALHDLYCEAYPAAGVCGG